MQETVDFDSFADCVSKPVFHLSSGSRLAAPDAPQPFVSPRFRVEVDDLSQCDIIFVRASAAVGKSTVARSLAARNEIPLLDLSKVSIAAGGISGFLDAIEGPSNAREAFHKGELPIIIDALDEGRLTNPAKSFEDFFEDTAKFIASNNGARRGPAKVLCFGRFEAVDLVRTIVEITDPAISVAVVDIGFFDREAARKLLKSYADQHAGDGSAWRNQPREKDLVVDLFFSAIATALGTEADDLWSTENGRAFAGYAPVLRAVGILLATVKPTFDSFRTKLAQQGSVEAWDVIERVIDFIFEREQLEKVVDPLTQAFQKDGFLMQGSPLPVELFDREEQVWFLLQLINGSKPDSLTTGITDDEVAGKFTVPWEVAKKRYLDLISTFIREHPFFVAARREFSNDVVASICISDAVIRGWDLHAPTQTALALLSRLPFVWNSVKSRFLDGHLLEGHIAGYILNSYWNDPLTKPEENGPVLVQQADHEHHARALLPTSRTTAVSLNVGLPLAFYGQISNCTVDDIHDTISFEGYNDPRRGGVTAGPGVFFVRGHVIVDCDRLAVKADEITFEGGEIWLAAKTFELGGQLQLTLIPGAEVGWSPELAEQYPWSRHSPNISRPSTDSSELSRLLSKCEEKLANVSAVVLFADYSVPSNDPSMSWARHLGAKWQALVACLLSSGLASSRAIGVRGSAAKVQVSFAADWKALAQGARAIDGEVSEGSIRQIIARVKALGAEQQRSRA